MKLLNAKKKKKKTPKSPNVVFTETNSNIHTQIKQVRGERWQVQVSEGWIFENHITGCP